MKRGRRWTRVAAWSLRGVAGLVLLTLLAAGGGYLYLRQSLPQINGTRLLPGLDKPVEVVRDRNGIPHIRAASVHDALFALGFVHAQDRLWQMEMDRRISAGRLSEVFGAKALPADKFLRTLGLHRYAEATLPHFDASTRAALDAYTAGVNAYLKTRRG